MLCVDYDVLVLHIGHVLSPITLSLSVSHAAAPSARLACMQLCLVRRSQTIRCLTAETLARQTTVRSQGVKGQPGKGRNNSRTFFLYIFGLVRMCIRLGVKKFAYVVSGDLLAPRFAPGSVNQGGGAVRGALPRYPAQ